MKRAWNPQFTLVAYTDENQIDYEAMGCLIKWYIAEGVHGFFALCHSTEIHCLSLSERLALTKEAHQIIGLPLRIFDDPLFLSYDEHSDLHTMVDHEPGQYLGHPTTCTLKDGKTVFAVCPKSHGFGQIVLKKSTDGGQTWSDRLPVPVRMPARACTPIPWIRTRMPIPNSRFHIGSIPRRNGPMTAGKRSTKAPTAIPLPTGTLSSTPLKRKTADCPGPRPE